MKNYFSSILILFALISGSYKTEAQDFLPFIHDNYAGATGMVYNPSSIVDSRYKFDMELLGFSNRIENNLAQINL